jgi:hypothetical protein
MIRHIEAQRPDSLGERIVSWLLVVALGVLLGMSLLGAP